MAKTANHVPLVVKGREVLYEGGPWSLAESRRLGKKNTVTERRKPMG